jgi:hypothetical protein
MDRLEYLVFNMNQTEDEEARGQTVNDSTPMPTGLSDNSNEANDAITYDTTSPAFSHEQFMRTNSSAFDNLLAVLDADTRGRGLAPPTARTSDADRTTTPGYLGSSSAVTNETTRSDMNQVQPTINHPQTSSSNQLPTSLRQQAWIDIPSFLFKLSKPTTTSRYKPLDILVTVRKPGGFFNDLESRESSAALSTLVRPDAKTLSTI